MKDVEIIALKHLNHHHVNSQLFQILSLKQPSLKLNVLLELTSVSNKLPVPLKTVALVQFKPRSSLKVLISAQSWTDTSNEWSRAVQRLLNAENSMSLEKNMKSMINVLKQLLLNTVQNAKQLSAHISQPGNHGNHALNHAVKVQ